MVLLILATACSPSAAEKLNQQGNDAYAEQAFEQALAMYQAAQLKEPQLAEPYYNAASSLYRQGEYEAALQQLQMALTFAEDESLAQSSLFNLGNASYNAQDTATAVAAYTESLLLNPDDQDAKYNLELALQQQQEQQQQEQEEQQSDSGEEQEESPEQSEDQQDQSQGGEGQEEENQEQQNEDQSADGQEGEQEQEQASQEGDQQQDQQEEEDQQEQPGQGQPQPGEEEPNGEQQPNYVPQPGERMTAEQAEQLLAAIAQDSDTLQERLEQIFVVPWQPPVQDW
jgi:tetratricopeptide (TPR) repeat protein